MTFIKQATIADTRFTVSVSGYRGKRRVALGIQYANPDDVELLTTGMEIDMTYEELEQVCNCLSEARKKILESKLCDSKTEWVHDSQYETWQGTRGK